MDWYYHDGSAQQGPIHADDFAARVNEGVIHSETYVWHSGMTDWKKLAEAVPDWKAQFTTADLAASTVKAQASGPVGGSVESCLECRRSFPKADLVFFNQGWVCADCKPGFVQKIKEGVETSALGVEYAGFWIRFAAKLIDGVILSVVQFAGQLVLMLLMAGIGESGDAAAVLAIVLGLVFALVSIAIRVAYDTYFVGKYQATPGKMACGLKVIRPGGEPLTYGRALGRHFAEWVTGLTLAIGYILAAFDEQKRSLHDRIADTRVVRK